MPIPARSERVVMQEDGYRYRGWAFFETEGVRIQWDSGGGDTRYSYETWNFLLRNDVMELDRIPG